METRTLVETVFDSIVAIDPGSSSGSLVLCTFNPDPKSPYTVEVSNLPDTIEGLWGLIHLTAEQLQGRSGNTLWVVENVGGSMPGNSAKSSRVFAEHVGALKMALIAAGTKSRWFPVPKKWMHELYKDDEAFPKGMERKALRKTYIYEDMRHRWKDIKFTKRQADAMAILTWAILTTRGQPK